MQSPIVRSAGNVSKWMQRNMVNEESEYYTKKKRPEIFFCNAWLVKGFFLWFYFYAMLRTLYFSAFVTIYTPSNLLHSCIACHLVASCVCTDVRFGRMKQANNKNSYNMHKSVKKKKKKKKKKPKRAFHC